MPLPVLICFSVAAGLLAALVNRSELRITPKHALLTRGFASFASFVLLLLVPSTAFLYVTHGDWMLMYIADSHHIPSALALFGLVLLAALCVGGYLWGDWWVKAQKEGLGALVALGFILCAIGVSILARDRIGAVGSYAQFHGKFGVVSFTASPLMASVALFGITLVGGYGYLLVRLHLAGR